MIMSQDVTHIPAGFPEYCYDSINDCPRAHACIMRHAMPSVMRMLPLMDLEIWTPDMDPDFDLHVIMKHMKRS